MNRRERRKLQKQGVQVPKDPSINIKLSDLGRGIMTPKPWENGEGYPDPTAYNALRPIMQEDAALEGKVNFLIKVLKFIIAESGFELLARIEIKDKKTGRCFR